MGGNVIINNIAADHIDLDKISRASVISDLSYGLKSVSDRFQRIFGFPIWSAELLNTREFLSGSSIHLFDSNIPSEEFIKYKSRVGDIDTQVDITYKTFLQTFLTSIPENTRIGNMIYIGFKTSADQFITLWTIPSLQNLNVQIDFELVEFKNDIPTPWSRFSHSCSWNDIRLGIKGVFSKYLMRAFQARTAIRVIIIPKSLRGKEKIITKSQMAFSLKGLRVRMVPVLNERGCQAYKGGLPAYTEVKTTETQFITDMNFLFFTFFDVFATNQDLEKMHSFVGLVELMRKYLSIADTKKVLTGFANLLWGEDAQELVRGCKEQDFILKQTAFNYIISQLSPGCYISDYSELIEKFYEDYK